MYINTPFETGIYCLSCKEAYATMVFCSMVLLSTSIGQTEFLSEEDYGKEIKNKIKEKNQVIDRVFTYLKMFLAWRAIFLL